MVKKSLAKLHLNLTVRSHACASLDIKKHDKGDLNNSNGKTMTGGGHITCTLNG